MGDPFFDEGLAHMVVGVVQEQDFVFFHPLGPGAPVMPKSMQNRMRSRADRVVSA